LAGNGPDASPARFTAKVVDEEGNPLTATSISAGFVTDEKPLKGVTDSNGLFVAECKTAMLPNAGFSVTKSDCYDTHVGFSFKKIADGRWEPWNPLVTGMVRRIVNPIPMYARTIEANLPSTESSAFDMIVGDWVAPYGKGMNTDLLFRVSSRRLVSWTDFDGSVTMSFGAEKDGVLRKETGTVDTSAYSWRYQAPDEEYIPSWRISVGYVPGRGYFETNESAAAYLRVRTATNEQGRIISANYGKIPHPIKVDMRESKTAWLKFTYYLNPTPNDRNLEFDPKQNLFKDLGPLEAVREP
jgi:hypothetical protein